MTSDNEMIPVQVGPPDLMFINSTIAPDRKLVRSHLMKKYWGDKKRCRRSRTQASHVLAPRDQPLPGLAEDTPPAKKEPLDICRAPTNPSHVLECNATGLQTSTVLDDGTSCHNSCRAVGCDTPAYGNLLCQTHTNQYQQLPIDRSPTMSSWHYDPFISFPVELTPRIKEVLDHAFSDRRPNIIFYRNIQLRNALMCPASFHQVVANILKWMRLNDSSKSSQEYEEKQELFHQAKATSLIRDMISTGSMNEGLVSAMAHLLGYIHLLRDTAALVIHRRALSEVISSMGGPGHLKPALRAFLFWVDVNVSCTLDVQPKFPLPSLNLAVIPPLYPYGTERIVNVWSDISPRDSDIINIFRQVAAFSVQLDGGITNSDAEQHLHWANWQGTMCHQLLNAQRSVDEQDERTIIREACRLALLLFLVPVRRVLSATMYSTEVHLEKLRLLLFDRHADWDKLHQLKQWIIAMGALEASTTSDIFRWVSLWMTQNDISTSSPSTELLRGVTEVMWVDDIHGKRFRDLQEVFQELDWEAAEAQQTFAGIDFEVSHVLGFGP